MNPHSSQHGTVLFEALLALIVLTLSIMALFALFSTNTTRMSKAQHQRDAALFADSVLSTLHAISDEQARQTNWLGFWTDFLSDFPATRVAHAFPDAWSNEASIAEGMLFAESYTPWETDNPWATNAGTIRFDQSTPGTSWSTGALVISRFGWYRHQIGDEAHASDLFGANEQFPSGTTRRQIRRHRLSACFMTNSVGETNRVAIQIEVWPGERGATSNTNRVAMYAEFVDQGVL